MNHNKRNLLLRRILSAIIMIVLLLSLAPAVTPVQAGTVNHLYVTPGGSDSSNNCLIQGSPCKTIIYAITQAAEGDFINIAAGTYKEGAVINIDKGITLDGAGAMQTILDGNNQYQVVNIGSSNPVTIQNLTIQNGYLAAGMGGSGAGIGNNPNSGANMLNLNYVVIRNNVQGGTDEGDLGGGMFNAVGAIANLDHVLLSNNTARRGGGIFNSSGQITVINSTISGNTGGGIETYGKTILANVTISGNLSSLDDYYYGYGLMILQQVALKRTCITPR